MKSNKDLHFLQIKFNNCFILTTVQTKRKLHITGNAILNAK